MPFPFSLSFFASLCHTGFKERKGEGRFHLRLSMRESSDVR